MGAIKKIGHFKEIKERFIDEPVEAIGNSKVFQSFDRYVGLPLREFGKGILRTVEEIAEASAKLHDAALGGGNMADYFYEMVDGLQFAYDATFHHGLENIAWRFHQIREDPYQVYLDSLATLGYSSSQALFIAPTLKPTAMALKKFAKNSAALGQALVQEFRKTVIPPPMAMTTAGVFMPIPAVTSGVAAAGGGGGFGVGPLILFSVGTGTSGSWRPRLPKPVLDYDARIQMYEAEAKSFDGKNAQMAERRRKWSRDLKQEKQAALAEHAQTIRANQADLEKLGFKVDEEGLLQIPDTIDELIKNLEDLKAGDGNKMIAEAEQQYRSAWREHFQRRDKGTLYYNYKASRIDQTTLTVENWHTLPGTEGESLVCHATINYSLNTRRIFSVLLDFERHPGTKANATLTKPRVLDLAYKLR